LEQKSLQERGVLDDHVRGILDLQGIRVAVAVEVESSVPILDEESIAHSARGNPGDFNAGERECAQRIPCAVFVFQRGGDHRADQFSPSDVASGDDGVHAVVTVDRIVIERDVNDVVAQTGFNGVSAFITGENVIEKLAVDKV